MTVCGCRQGHGETAHCAVTGFSSKTTRVSPLCTWEDATKEMITPCLIHLHAISLVVPHH